MCRYLSLPFLRLSADKNKALLALNFSVVFPESSRVEAIVFRREGETFAVFNNPFVARFEHGAAKGSFWRSIAG